MTEPFARPDQSIAQPVPIPPIFRRLTASDRDALYAHLLRLDGADRIRRFCGGVSDAGIAQHCQALRWEDAIVLGCLDAAVLRGVAELRRLEGTPWRAELALTVEAAYQSRGLGSELLRRSLIAARNRCIAQVTMICLVENRRMQTLARKFGSTLALRDGEVTGRLAAGWPSTLTLLEELASETRAYLDRSRG